jgi:amino acid transporter
MLFNVPPMASQAGATAPLVFLLSGIGLMLLGIGVAMALGVWSWIGFEAGAVYGEEARNPRRAVPVAIFSVVAFLTLLYVFTSYSATIGYGWQHAVDQFGNLSANPTPYYPLAATYVGSWLQALMIIAISTGSLACGLAFHNGMVRYLYAMGREGILPRIFGRTHPRFRSPHIAIIAQSAFSAVLMLAFAFVITEEQCRRYNQLRAWHRIGQMGADRRHPALYLAGHHRHHRLRGRLHHGQHRGARLRPAFRQEELQCAGPHRGPRLEHTGAAHSVKHRQGVYWR